MHKTVRTWKVLRKHKPFPLEKGSQKDQNEQKGNTADDLVVIRSTSSINWCMKVPPNMVPRLILACSPFHAIFNKNFLYDRTRSKLQTFGYLTLACSTIRLYTQFSRRYSFDNFRSRRSEIFQHVWTAEDFRTTSDLGMTAICMDLNSRAVILYLDGCHRLDVMQHLHVDVELKCTFERSELSSRSKRTFLSSVAWYSLAEQSRYYSKCNFAPWNLVCGRHEQSWKPSHFHLRRVRRKSYCIWNLRRCRKLWTLSCRW